MSKIGSHVATFDSQELRYVYRKKSFATHRNVRNLYVNARGLIDFDVAGNLEAAWGVEGTLKVRQTVKRVD